MAIPSLQNLLKEYTSKLNVDPRVFSQEVMSYDQFAQPFNAYINQVEAEYLRPEFERFQLNPFEQQSAQQYNQLNQNVGTSGAWRTAQAGADLNNLQQQQGLQRDTLWKQYNDQLLGVRNQFETGLINPLYQSRMNQFYDAPIRDTMGGQGEPLAQPTFQQLNMQPFTGQGQASLNSPYTLAQQYNSGI